jgi:hypothetical protein
MAGVTHCVDLGIGPRVATVKQARFFTDSPREVKGLLPIAGALLHCVGAMCTLQVALCRRGPLHARCSAWHAGCFV